MPATDERHLTHRLPSALRLAVAVVVAALAAGRADAQTYSWTQPETGTTANWSAGPWSPGTPVAGTTTVLDFNVPGGAGGFTFTNNIGSLTLNGMVFDNWGAGTLTLPQGTNALTFGGTNPFLTNDGPGAVTISGGATTGGLVLGATTTVTGAGNGTTTVSSVVSGAGGLAINQTGLGIFSLTGNNTFAGGVTLTNGILSLGNANATGSAATITIDGGALRFTSAIALAKGILANADLVVAGGTSTPTITGVISGGGGLRLQNYNTTAGLTLQGANTYAGATTIQTFIPNSTQSGPTLTLSGANGSIASTATITVGNNARLQITNTTAANNTNRIPDAAPLVVNGGQIGFTGVAASSETLGNLTVSGGMQLLGSPTGTPTLTFGTLTRVDNATLHLTSSTFGLLPATSGGATPTNGTRVFFSGGLPVFAAGSGTGQEIGIVPFVVAGGTTTARSFATYDAANGLQVVQWQNADYFAQIPNPSAFTPAAVLNRNVRLNGNGATTTTGSQTYDMGGQTFTVNSLTSNSSTLTFTNGTLEVRSGAIVNLDGVVWDAGATLAFGTSTGYLYTSGAQVFRGTSQITGSGGVVVAGFETTTGTTTFENPNGNPFTGGLTLNGTTRIGFRQDNQLGAAGGSVTLAGGQLAYNAADDLTVSRPIRLGSAHGGVTFNVVATNGTAGNATAATVLTLSGPITGPGGFIKEGVGVVRLAGANTYAGGTVVSAGALQFNTAANLGSGPVTLNGGTLQPLTSGTVANPVRVNASSTIHTDADVTLSSPVTTVGQLYGTANPTLTKAGSGTLTLTAASPNLSGPVAVTGGTFALAGAGTAPQATAFTLPAGTALVLDNTAGYAPDRVGDLARLTLTGGTLSYVAGSAPTADPAERFGTLTASSLAGRINIDAALATTPTILRFNSLTPITTGSLLFSGTNLGGSAGNFTRILFDTAPALTAAGTIANAFFSNLSMGASQGAAAYDPLLGVVLFNSPPVSGTVIDNYAPTGTPTAATFTTAGPTTANTGAVVFDLILDGGGVELVNGANPPSGTNNNTPTGTLAVGNAVTAVNGAKLITAAAGTTNPTIAFGASVARFATTSDLTVAAPVAVSGSVGLEKTGAGELTLNGPVAITGGPLAASAGTLTLGPTSTVTGAPGVTLVNAGTAANFNATTAPTLGTLSLGAGTTANVNQNVTATTATGAGTVAIATGRTLTFTGTTATADALLTGAGGVGYAPSAVSILTLAGANTFAGGVTGSANARLTITNPAGFGTGAVNVSAQTASSSAATPTVGFNFGAGGSGTVANNFVLSAAASIDTFFATRTSTNQTVTLTGVISGGNAGSRLVVGSNSATNAVVLSNPNSTFLGTVVGQTGILAVTSNGALGNANNALTLQSGTLRFDAADVTLAATRTVTVTGGYTINTNGFNATIAGEFLGDNSLTLAKTGAGTLALSLPGSLFSFAGPVNVNAGTLLVNGGLPGSAGLGEAVTVNNGGTVGGSGSVGTSEAFRNLNVNSGGTVTGGNPAAAVGTAPGTLTVDGPLTINAGGNFRVRVTGGAPAGAGTGGSSGGGANNGFLSQVSSLGGSLTFDPLGNVVIDGTGVNFVLTQPYSYAVASYGTGGATGFPITDQARFQTIGFLGNNFSLTDGGGVLYLNFTPVPEPATVLGPAAAGLGLAGLVRRARRRAGRAAGAA